VLIQGSFFCGLNYSSNTILGTTCKIASGYRLCQGTTSVVPQIANSDSGFSRRGIANIRKQKRGAKQAAKKTGSGLNATKTIPQGLKPSVYFVAFAARLKSCPDAFGRGSEVFRSL
jgi:hypothetical protein